jgi:hypothetical protein
MKKAVDNNGLVFYIVVSIDQQGVKNVESSLPQGQLFESFNVAKDFADRFTKRFPQMCCYVNKISL